jgi:sporulation protein YlmC with PRC-barrel domain
MDELLGGVHVLACKLLKRRWSVSTSRARHARAQALQPRYHYVRSLSAARARSVGTTLKEITMVQDTTRTTGSTTTTSGFAGSGATNKGARITGTSHLDDHSGPGPEIMAASSFEGETVVNNQGDTVGEIEEIMLDVRSGRIAYAVMSVGGFLGIGEKYFAIPWRAFTMDTDNHRFILDVDKQRLENAPGFDKDHWPAMADQAWATQVHTYYSTRPYWE